MCDRELSMVGDRISTADLELYPETPLPIISLQQDINA